MSICPLGLHNLMYVRFLLFHYLMLFLHYLYSFFIVTFLSDLMSLMKRSKRQLRKTSKRQKEEVGEHFLQVLDLQLSLHLARVYHVDI